MFATSSFLNSKPSKNALIPVFAKPKPSRMNVCRPAASPIGWPVPPAFGRLGVFWRYAVPCPLGGRRVVPAEDIAPHANRCIRLSGWPTSQPDRKNCQPSGNARVSPHRGEWLMVFVFFGFRCVSYTHFFRRKSRARIFLFLKAFKTF